MYYKRARLGTKVRITKNIDQAAQDTEGTIIELRGYNYDRKKIVGRYVQVWATETPDGIKSQKNISCTTEVLEEIKPC